ncbi:uncharacterized protein TNCV_1712391 [Trichonephila clavipes]|nr:uncharacterized protein TNCV_1712391 [Trichonephila clavipes]
MAALVSEYTLEFFTLLNARGKKELIEWCMKEGLIASSYECPKCNEQMGLNERKSVVLDGFEWRCRKKGFNRKFYGEKKVFDGKQLVERSPNRCYYMQIDDFLWQYFIRANSHNVNEMRQAV